MLEGKSVFTLRKAKFHGKIEHLPSILNTRFSSSWPPSPSNARIACLEEENRRLQSLLSRLSLQSGKPQKQNWCSSSPYSINQAGEDGTSRPSECNPSTVLAEPTPESLNSVCPEPTGIGGLDTESRSHGPTSAVADGMISSYAMRQRAASSINKHEDITRNQLLAESAKQRK